MTRFGFILLASLLACAALFVGCGDDDDDDDTGGLDDDDTGDTDPPQFDGLVSAIGGAGSATLSWDAATDESEPITYSVYMAESSGAQDFAAPVATTEELTIDISGLTICSEYFFVVRATDAAGNQESNTVERSVVAVSYDCGYDETERVRWTFVPPAGSYSVRTVGWIDDVDEDGVPDALVHAYDSVYTPDGADSTWVVSGASEGTGDIAWGAHPANDSNPASDSGGYGDAAVTATGDLNGDGFPDVLLATVWGNSTAYALDGLTGDVLWFFSTITDPASPDDGWVYDIHSAPDVSGDGVPEVIFGGGSDNDSGWMLDGATGDVRFRLPATDAVISAAPVGDVNGDDVGDVVFGGGDYEYRVFCVDGASSGTASVLWTYDTAGSNYAVASIDDVDGDGVREVLVGSWYSYAVICLDGADGEVLWSSDAHISPMRVVVLDDVNGDNQQDVAITGLQSYFVDVIDGRNGDTIWSERGPSADYIWALDRIDDVTGDGINDVVAGTFDSYVLAFDGTDGGLLWQVDTGDAKVLTVRGTPDVTGDCVPDVIAGNQDLGDGAGSGTTFLLEGCP